MGYSSNVIKGVSWMSGFRIVTRILAFGKIAVLARVLTPAQFGIFGIASLILGLLEMLTETGINVFLIQIKKDLNEYINSAWVVSIVRGVIIGFIVLILSPLIILFFNIPEALNILMLISVVPIIRGFINPSVIKLQKELQFNKEFWYRSLIFLFDAVISVFLAVTTQSVYSLVWGLIAGAILEVILSFIIIRPLPRWRINKEYFSEIFQKGKWVTAYGFFNYIAQEGDNILVGKLLGSSALGIYQMAYKISILPISEVTDVVSKVVFPIYSRIEDNKRRLIKAFLKSTLVVSLLTILIGTILYLFTEEIVLLILGKSWLVSVPVLKVLAIYGVLRAIFGSASALFLGVGKQKYVTIMTLGRFLGLALTIIPFVSIFGLIGAAFSALFSVIVEIPIIIYFIFNIFKKKQ